MKLYFSPGACSLSVHITLREAGLAFDTEKVDTKTHRTAADVDFYTINPKGYVPAMRLDNGELLTEGTAIVQYLADLAPNSGLAPANGSLERVRLQEWLNFISTEIHKGFSPLWNPASAPETRQAAQERLSHWFGWLNSHFAANDFLLGGRFSVADGYLFTCVNWCNYIGMSLQDWPKLGDFMQRIAARPAVRAAMQAEGLLG
ncbi:glutathione transferase GstA [Chitinimonas arctica]|uniref:Glutathione transferase GstA n=1 Tax=Chitinimonas arctica TaxID=2594795 RepID=A0A516SF62_9NEIS|nr:glutathione transferase GstA [Chitinimonas arctica]QDQ26783.1 glutathione transferase GstA [Chitinimonas arctica]